MEGLVTTTFWAGKRVLVTGHTGFKGAWLVAWLTHLGAEVVGFSLDPPSQPYLFEEAGLAHRVESIRGDVADYEALQEAVRRTAPDLVFHLAAQAIVRESYRDPLWTLRTNIMGTACLLQALRGVDSVKAAIVVTSDKCYEGEPPPGGHREEDRLGGLDPYSASKAGAELITHSWRRAFRDDLPPLASGRAGNVIGGGDWGVDRLIPDAVRAVAAGEALTLRHPDAVRPWQHVLDVLHGYLLLAERLVADPPRFARGWNFAPEPRAVTVLSLIETFYGVLGTGHVRSELMSTGGMTEKPHLIIDPSDANELLGWRARLTVEEAVEWTASWYRRWLRAPSSAHALMLEQISDYEALS